MIKKLTNLQLEKSMMLSMKKTTSVSPIDSIEEQESPPVEKQPSKRNLHEDQKPEFKKQGSKSFMKQLSQQSKARNS